MKIYNQYFKIITLVFFSMVLLRFLEVYLIAQSFPIDTITVKGEILGILFDLNLASFYTLLFFPIYYIFAQLNLSRLINLIFVLCAGLIGNTHLLIIKYFSYQLLPLDIFLYKHDLNEIEFTIQSSSVSFNDLYFSIILFNIIYLFLSLWFFKSKFLISKYIKIIPILCFPLGLYLNVFQLENINKFTQNKSNYFFSKSLQYFFKSENDKHFSAIDFQNLYPEKSFNSIEYPLIHEFEKDNKISSYFETFKSKPNVVILIIEGLNDDFVHPYHQSEFMPFLMGLKDSSLYWDRCFTLGERSYAAVPSIVGGLPYGDLGFTLLDQYPNHLSLISILKQNGYFTTFYYGQGSWFHHKDAFFRCNGIDLIIDNDDYQSHFEKIIVGKDNFFWGYHDKDLFAQSLYCIDSLNSTPRLDIYFTGSMHDPFIASEEEKYLKITQQLLVHENSNFYSTYSKYLKTLPFTDDALKEFFEQYKKRADFDNTIFIITGDHPMTELPRDNELKKYHVPLIMYANNLKSPQVFHQIVSHLDIYESVLSLLEPNLDFIPLNSTSLGKNLFSESNNFYVFMEGNRELIDCYYNGYYIHRDDLYAVDEKFNIQPIYDDSIFNLLKNKLDIFIRMNEETTKHNKIISNDLFCESLSFQMLFSDDTTDSFILEKEYHNLTPTITVKQNEINYNIQFDYNINPESDISVIYEIKNPSDSTLHWQAMKLSPDKNQYFYQFKLPITDSISNFKCYLWNKTKSKTTISGYNSFAFTE